MFSELFDAWVRFAGEFYGLGDIRCHPFVA